MTLYQIMRELHTTALEPKMGHEYSKEENVLIFSNEERPVSKKRKLILENSAMRTKSAIKPVGGGTSTFTLEDNPMDFIIRDLEGAHIRIVEYEVEIQHVGEHVGNPRHESLVVTIQEAIQDPHRLRKLDRKMDHLTTEMRKTTE